VRAKVGLAEARSAKADLFRGTPGVARVLQTARHGRSHTMFIRAFLPARCPSTEAQVTPSDVEGCRRCA
jgi:hypothetical protein